MKSSPNPIAIIAALGISLSGAGVFAAHHLPSSFRVSPKSRVVLPATPVGQDSAVFPFERTKLLNFRPPMGLVEQTQDWTTLPPDTSGLVWLKRPGADGEATTLLTHLRAARFAKGKLKLKSNVPAELLLDGKKIASVAKADSLPSEDSSDVTLSPEMTARLQINLLSFADDPADPQVGLEFLPDEKSDSIEISFSHDLKGRFDLSTVALGKRVYSASISPDGKYVSVCYSNSVDGNRNTYNTVVYETATLREVYSSSDFLGWMPKSSKLYYTHHSLSGTGFDIFVVDPARPEPEMIGTVADNSFYFSPDEKFVIYQTKVDGPQDSGPLKRLQEPDDRMPGHRDVYYLIRQDLKSGTISYLTYGGPGTYLSDISPDSKRLLYISTRTTPDHYPFYDSKLIELDLNTLKTDTVVNAAGEGGLTSAIYSPDGRRAFVTGGPQAFGSIGVNAGDHPIPNDFDTQGYILDLKTRDVKAMTRDFDPALQGTPTWNHADGKIYFRAEEGFYVPVFCLDPSTGKITRLDTDTESARTFSMGDNQSRWLATVGQSFHYTGRATLLDLKSGKTRLLADPHQEVMGSLELGKEEPWTFTAEDGSFIDGMMVLPPDFDESKKYPLIVYYYGGTAPSNRSMTHNYGPHLFASRDYVVYILNPSGTTGYGQEFSARHVNAWGDRTADEIIEGVKKFCKAHPFVDDKKIGCIGASYGGFMTQLLLTKTDIFAAGVSHAGISNVTSYWGEGYWGYSYNSVAAAKSYPWSNPELYTTHGSLFNADKIHTPLLLLHGTDDTNVPPGESIQLFNALRILGRDVELITVEGENHVIQDYQKRLLWQATIMAWFARWLQDDPSWWDSLY